MGEQILGSLEQKINSLIILPGGNVPIGKRLHLLLVLVVLLPLKQAPRPLDNLSPILTACFTEKTHVY